MRPLSRIALRQLTRGRINPASRGLSASAKWRSSEISPNDESMADLPKPRTFLDTPPSTPSWSSDGTSGSAGSLHRFEVNRNGQQTKVECDSRVYLTSRNLLLQTFTGNLKLPFFYLRDLCKCPQCVDPHSKQRSFRTSDIRWNVYPRHVKLEGKQLEIKWENDIPGYDKEHTSTWNVDYLKKPVIDTHDITSIETKPRRWDAEMMRSMQHWISFDEYMNNDAEFAAAMKHLSHAGLIFVKDIPSSREMVEKIATRMGPLRNTFYGSTWDVRTVPQAKNVAYTNQFLGFHMDLLYMNEPPGYQLLHCLENSCEGGESLFTDTFRVANLMRTMYPDFWKILTMTSLSYEYVHEGSIYHNTWPVFELGKEEHLRHVNYSPPFQSALPLSTGANLGEDRTRLRTTYNRALRMFAQLLQHKTFAFKRKLNPGECVIFANRRVAHARNEFNTSTGSRWLAGAYVDEDALLSRYAVCQKQYPGMWDLAGLELDLQKVKGRNLQGSLIAIQRRLGRLVHQEIAGVGDVASDAADKTSEA